MKLSDHFDTTEFACKCGCGFTMPDAKLIDVLERIRNYYQEPVHISSGCRCPYWNAHEIGKKGSKHLQGKAADIWIDHVQATNVYELLDKWYPDTFGLGRYYTFTHVDVREKKARW